MTWPTEMTSGLLRPGLSLCSSSQPLEPVGRSDLREGVAGLDLDRAPAAGGGGDDLLGRGRGRLRCDVDLRRGAVQPELARAGGPGAPALLGQHPLGDDDLLLAAARGGPATRAAEGPPGAGGELQAAAEAVAGVDGPVAAALALRDAVPDGAAGVGVGRGGGGQRGADHRAGDGRAGECPTGVRRCTVTTAVARHGRPPARRPRTSPGEGAMGAAAAHRVRSCPVLMSGSGSRNHRTGRGALRFRDPRAGSPFGSRARYDDHGTERNLDETVSRSGDGRRRIEITIGLVTPRDAQPDRVTPRCVSVTRFTDSGSLRWLTPTP